MIILLLSLLLFIINFLFKIIIILTRLIIVNIYDECLKLSKNAIDDK